jgi:RNA polymerase sigma-70 factor (ECF subfamily)
MQATSLTLLDRVKLQSDRDAWARWLSVYEPLLVNWLRGQGLQPADACDVVQDVLVLMCRELPNFEHNGRIGAFRNWLRSVMVNCLRAFWRKRSVGAGPVADLADKLADPGSGLIGQWDREHDAFVLARLTELIEPEFEPKSWQAFAGTVLQGRPTAEVATELGMKINTVLQAKSRILRRLRQEREHFQE